MFFFIVDFVACREGFYVNDLDRFFLLFLHDNPNIQSLNIGSGDQTCVFGFILSFPPYSKIKFVSIVDVQDFFGYLSRNRMKNC